MRLRAGKATEAVELSRWLVPESSRSTVTLAQSRAQPVPIDRSDPLVRPATKFTDAAEGPVAVPAKYGSRSSSPTGSEPPGWHDQQDRADACAWAVPVAEADGERRGGGDRGVGRAGDGPSWSVSGGAVPESLSASAWASAGSQEDPSPRSEQPDSRPASRLTWLVPLRARPLALRTNPESMLPLTYGKVTLGVGQRDPGQRAGDLERSGVGLAVPDELRVGRGDGVEQEARQRDRPGGAGVLGRGPRDLGGDTLVGIAAAPA